MVKYGVIGRYLRSTNALEEIYFIAHLPGDIMMTMMMMIAKVAIGRGWTVL